MLHARAAESSGKPDNRAETIRHLIALAREGGFTLTTGAALEAIE